MDNLESGTYEILEKDPFKYAKYQSAIHEAMEDITFMKITQTEDVMYA